MGGDPGSLHFPGLKKEEVKVEVLDRYITGERSRENVEKNDKWHRVEKSSGKFLRKFRLWENAKKDQTKASMEKSCFQFPHVLFVGEIGFKQCKFINKKHILLNSYILAYHGI